MMRILLFLLTIIPCGASAQIHVRIADSATGRGLPYASLSTTDRKWGRVSDSAGVVAVPDSLLGKTLQASFVGYDSRAIVVREMATVGLSQRVLPEVVVRACARDAVKRLGWTRRTANYGYGWGGVYPGYLWATYIPNTRQQEGRLEKLHFVVQHNRDARTDAPLRIHIYTAGDSVGKWQEELTTSDVQVRPGHAGHIVVDLSETGIRIPASGVYVAFEFIEESALYYNNITVREENGTRREGKHYAFSLQSMPRGTAQGYGGIVWSQRLGRIGDGPAVGLDVRYCID